MAEHNELGKLEEMAVDFFERRIYYFGDQLDFSKAEIDIIAQKNTLAVEVKTLLLEFGLPQDFVKPIQLLLKAVNAYVNEKSWMLKSVLTS
jgi:Holliday junction resolvase-like predicted endonuclease